MTGKTHQVLGIAASLSWYLAGNGQPSYGPATLGAVLVSSHLAALVPDFDQAAAKFWQSIPYGKVVGKVADPFLKHRNFSHSLLGVGLVYLLFRFLFGLFPDYWGIDAGVVLMASVIAFASHLLADLLTVEGIPLFFPYKRMIGLPPQPLHGFRIMTGKWFENLVIFPALNLWLILTIWLGWDKIKLILFKT